MQQVSSPTFNQNGRSQGKKSGVKSGICGGKIGGRGQRRERAEARGEPPPRRGPNLTNETSTTLGNYQWSSTILNDSFYTKKYKSYFLKVCSIDLVLCFKWPCIKDAVSLLYLLSLSLLPLPLF